MTQIAIKGYGTVVHVDDEGCQHSAGTFNSINRLGLERIIKADTILNKQSYVFHYILLTHNLPRDKFVFTKDELIQYGANYLPIDKNPVTMKSFDEQSLSIDFDSLVTPNTGTVDVQCDTISLAYTDDLGNIYVCSYAEFLNPTTQVTEPFTIRAGGSVKSNYRINLSIANNEDNIRLFFTDYLPGRFGTEFGGEYISTQYVNDPATYARATKLPYVEGSNKLTYHVDKTTGYTWDCWLITGLFTLTYRVNGNITNPGQPKGIRHIVEVELILAEEAESKLGVVLAAPTGLSETLRVLDYANGAGNIIEFKADPLSEVEFYLKDKQISKTITDSTGFGLAIFSSSYYDPDTNESRQLEDGLLLKVKTINALGTFEQDYIPIDNVANRIKHWNWIDATHLMLVGRLNDVVNVYIDYGYTKTGQTLREVEVISATLTTPDTRYGYDAAIAIVELDLLTQQQLFYTSRVKVGLTDAAGNKDDWYDVEITVGDLGLPNLFELAQPGSRYTKSVEHRDTLYRIPLITKGTKS